MKARLLYINYAAIEAEFALQLASDLKNAGVAAWMDRLQLPSTVDWSPRGAQALERAAGMLLVLSPDWFHADYCQRELAYAHEHNLPLFAVALRPLAEGDYPRGIDPQRVIDFSEWRGELTYRERFRRLLMRLKDDSPAWAGKAPDDETRYLINLLARMEAAQGIPEYVMMNDKPHPSSALERRAAPKLAPLWGNLGKVTTLDKVRHAPTAQPRWRRGSAPDIKSALGRRPHAVLIGAPGSGKTAALQRLTLDATRARLADPSLPVPVYVNLAHWGEEQDFESFLVSRVPMLRNVIDLAAEGGAILYIDGLNEVTQNVAARLLQIRAWLSSRRAPQRVLFACRTRNYDEALDLDLPMIELEPLDDEAVWALTVALVGEEGAEHAYRRIFAPESAHPADGQTRALARSPMLLGGLVFLYKSAPTSDLPTTMGSLIKRWMAVMWLWKRMTNMPTWLPFREVESALAKLAYILIERDLPTGIPYTDAIKLVSEEKLLRAAQNAGLIDIEADVVAFRQPLLAEYFAAQGVQYYNARPSISAPHFNHWGERIATRWDQVIVILAGLSPNADRIVTEITAVDPFLAALVLAGGADASDEARAAAVNLLVEITFFVTGEGRLAAVRALADLDFPDTLEALLEVTRSGTWQVRQAANWLLHRFPAPVHRDLFEAVREWDWKMDERVAAALRSVGVGALPLLLQVLRDEHWSRRRGAAWALGEIGDPAAVPGLVEALADDESVVRGEAAGALKLLQDLDSLPMLLDALRDPDGRVRRAVLEAVIAFGSHAVDGLVDLLRDEAVMTRRAALEGLALIGDAAAAPAVMSLARHPQVDVRGAALAALGKMRYIEALPLLTAALGDTEAPQGKDVRVCDVAAGALAYIDTDEARAALSRWRGGEAKAMPQNGRGSANIAKGRLPGSNRAPEREQQHQTHPERMSIIVDGLYDKDWRIRKRTVEALADMPAAVKVPALLEALHDEDSQVRYAAVLAMDGAQGDSVVWGMIETLQDSEHLVGDAAAAFLVHIGQPAVPELMNALLDEDVNVRGRAVEALGKIGDTAAIPRLRMLLNDTATPSMERERICDKVVIALRGMGEEVETSHTDGATPPLHEVETRQRLGGEVNTPHVNGATPPLYEVEMQQRAGGEVKTPFADELDENSDLLLPYDDLPAAVADFLIDDLPIEPFAVERETVKQITHQQLDRMLTQLHSSDFRQRQDAAKELRAHTRQLGGFADDEFAAGLVAALKDNDHLVRWSVTEALAYIKHPSIVPALCGMLVDPSQTVRLAALQALYEQDDGSAAEAVIGALHDKQAQVRESAAQLLGKLGGAGAVAALTAMLGEKEGFLRRAAAMALGELKANAAVGALIPLLKDSERQVCYAAIDALGAIGDPKAVEALSALLIGSDVPMWDSRSLADVAAQALERIGTPEALAAVKKWREAKD
jgi:HEAT repeat protein